MLGELGSGGLGSWRLGSGGVGLEGLGLGQLGSEVWGRGGWVGGLESRGIGVGGVAVGGDGVGRVLVLASSRFRVKSSSLNIIYVFAQFHFIRVKSSSLKFLNFIYSSSSSVSELCATTSR